MTMKTLVVLSTLALVTTLWLQVDGTEREEGDGCLCPKVKPEYEHLKKVYFCAKMMVLGKKCKQQSLYVCEMDDANQPGLFVKPCRGKRVKCSGKESGEGDVKNYTITCMDKENPDAPKTFISAEALYE